MSGKARYIPSETVLSDITCDDNGAYNKTNKVKHDYYVAVDEGGVKQSSGSAIPKTDISVRNVCRDDI